MQTDETRACRTPVANEKGDGRLYCLTYESQSGAWWQTTCTTDLDGCVRAAEKIERGPLSLERRGEIALYAKGQWYNYFITPAGPGATETLEPSPLRSPYPG